MEQETVIIDQFKSGDINAFEIMFNHYYKALVLYGKTMLKDHEEAEDIVQQVFISMWEKRMTIEIHTSLKSLLYKSVYNACLNRMKQQAVRGRYAKEIQLSSTGVVVTQNDLQQKELQKKLDEAMNLLPEQCARIFKMSRFEQLKYQQIADQLGLSVKTVENQMGKALRIMREQLKEYLPLLLIILSQYYRD